MRISSLSVVLVQALATLACTASIESAAPSGSSPPSEVPPATQAPGATAVPGEATPASAALRSAIDAIVAPEIDPSGAGGKIVGAAVAVIGPDVRAVISYGVTGVGEKALPASDTIFEIGSNTKPMTGLILAEEVVKGSMKLDDPVSRFLPAGVTMPTYHGAPIQLVHLATHTSGLADFPDNMVGKPPNPAAGYTRELLFDYLGRATLPAAPGGTMAYSNLGFGLLGVALADAEKASTFEAMFIAHLGDPLGMKDTRVIVPAGSAARTAHGSRHGKTMPAVQIDTLEGGGALHSTAADMLAFVAANLAPPASLREAVLLSQTVRFDIDGRKMALGFSVETKDGRTSYSKGGGTAGFTSHVRFTTSPPAGVIVLTNTAQADAVNPMTEKILDAVVASATAR